LEKGDEGGFDGFSKGETVTNSAITRPRPKPEREKKITLGRKKTNANGPSPLRGSWKAYQIQEKL
jgi:hypothetical protein